ncbi:MAG: UDP-glucose/GDP-mannose dehydrogenase family protein [Actinomycetota bacterium]
MSQSLPKPKTPSGGFRRIAIIGAGYVGLPTAALLSHFGHSVIVAERDQRKLDILRDGRSPIFEKDLEEYLRAGVSAKKLTFSDSAAEAVKDAEFVFLCVPTPQGDDGSADLSYIVAAAQEIGPHLIQDAIVVNKSTVPVGTAHLVERETGRDDIRVVSNPEFLREGTALADSLAPDRIVVGADDQEAAAAVAALFSPTHAPVVVTDATTAETIKYASNAFLATKLSFINAIAGLAEAVGADVKDIVLGLGYDKRIGFEFLKPGPGWGGSCLPKDTSALVKIGEDHGYDFALLRGAIASNEAQLERIVDKVLAAVDGKIAGAAVAVWGLTFKAGTDDRRASPALDICQRLVAKGAKVTAFDPEVPPANAGADDLRGITLATDSYEAVRDAQVVVLLTEWAEFRWLDFSKVADLMQSRVIVDARNHLDPAPLKRLGFIYQGVGRT